MTDLGNVLAIALQGYRLHRAGVHGPGHWMRVLQNGRELVAHTPGADLEVVELFALLHDCRRVSDNIDPQHGQRAADCVSRLWKAGRLKITADQSAMLVSACLAHELGRVSSNPTIGACWDADRLELSRLGRKPIERLLSTKAAVDPVIQATAWERGSNQQIDLSEVLNSGWR